MYSNYERPERIQTEGLYRDAVTGETLAATDTTSLGNMPWQQVFVEPQLQSLISKALENNADLRTADLAIEQVKAGLRVSRLAYLRPQRCHLFLRWRQGYQDLFAARSGFVANRCPWQSAQCEEAGRNDPSAD